MIQRKHVQLWIISIYFEEGRVRLTLRRDLNFNIFSNSF